MGGVIALLLPILKPFLIQIAESLMEQFTKPVQTTIKRPGDELKGAERRLNPRATMDRYKGMLNMCAVMSVLLVLPSCGLFQAQADKELILGTIEPLPEAKGAVRLAEDEVRAYVAGDDSSVGEIDGVGGWYLVHPRDMLTLVEALKAQTPPDPPPVAEDGQ